MPSAPLSLEAIRLHLIDNQSFNVAPHQRQKVSLEELIEYLVDSLAAVDKASRDKAECLLSRIGRSAIPYLLRGLESDNNQIRSSAAMALLRFGHTVVDDIKTYYVNHNSPQTVAWIVAFMLEELGEATANVAELPETSKKKKSPVVSLATAV